MSLLVTKSLVRQDFCDVPSRPRIFVDSETAPTSYLNDHLSVLGRDEYIIEDIALAEPRKGINCVVFDVHKGPLNGVGWKRDDVFRLLRSGAKVLWVSSIDEQAVDRAHISHNSYEGNISDTPAEWENLVKLSVLDCNDQSSLACHIHRILLDSVIGADGHRPKELHFLCKQGQILIPRLLPNGKISPVSSKKQETEAGLQKENSIVQRLFHRSGTVLTLKMDSLAKPEGLLFYEDDYKNYQDLPMNEVEISLEACHVTTTKSNTDGGVNPSASCSGVVTAVGNGLGTMYQPGTRVFCWNVKTIANKVHVDADYIQRVPDGMPMKVAAMIPNTIAMAYHVLVHIADLQKGQVILVHSADNAFGHAVVHWAKYYGAEVVTTVDTEEQSTLLARQFGLSPERIISTKNTALWRCVRRLAKGSGVDIIIHLGPEEPIEDILACLRPLGVLVKVNRLDMHDHDIVRRTALRKNLIVAHFDVGQFFERQPKRVKRLIEEITDFVGNVGFPQKPTEYIRGDNVFGAFPSPTGEYEIADILLDFPENIWVRCMARSGPDMSLDQQGTYIVAGDLETAMPDICRFFCTQGARKIIMLVEDTPQHVKSSNLLGIQPWLDSNHVRIEICKASDERPLIETLGSFLQHSSHVRGIIHFRKSVEVIFIVLFMYTLKADRVTDVNILILMNVQPNAFQASTWRVI